MINAYRISLKMIKNYLFILNYIDFIYLIFNIYLCLYYFIYFIVQQSLKRKMHIAQNNFIYLYDNLL